MDRFAKQKLQEKERQQDNYNEGIVEERRLNKLEEENEQ